MPAHLFCCCRRLEQDPTFLGGLIKSISQIPRPCTVAYQLPSSFILPMSSLVGESSAVLDTTIDSRLLLPVTIYYEDTDCVGIVYHSNYLKYFERGREQLLGQDALVSLFDAFGKSFVVVNVKIDFKRSARHGDNLIVRTIPTVESSFRLEFDQTVWRINRDDSQTLVVKGTVQMVCVTSDMKICGLPEMITVDMRASFGELLDPKPKVGRRLPLKKQIAATTKQRAKCEFEIEIYYEDTDFTGVVYYANYLKFMERARSQLFGFKQLAIMKRDHRASFAVYSANLDYKNGATIGDLIVVKTECVIESDYRVAFEQNVFRRRAALEDDGASGDVLLVKGSLVLCCIDDGGKLVKLPQMVFELPAVPGQ